MDTKIIKEICTEFFYWWYNQEKGTNTLQGFDKFWEEHSHRWKDDLEMDKIVRSLGVSDDWRVENIKDVAMNRYNVKKSKRPSIKRILDMAFDMLKEKS